MQTGMKQFELKADLLYFFVLFFSYGATTKFVLRFFSLPPQGISFLCRSPFPAFQHPLSFPLRCI
jgi:hypothetical protein